MSQLVLSQQLHFHLLGISFPLQVTAQKHPLHTSILTNTFFHSRLQHKQFSTTFYSTSFKTNNTITESNKILTLRIILFNSNTSAIIAELPSGSVSSSSSSHFQYEHLGPAFYRFVINIYIRWKTHKPSQSSYQNRLTRELGQQRNFLPGFPSVFEVQIREGSLQSHSFFDTDPCFLSDELDAVDIRSIGWRLDDFRSRGVRLRLE